MSVASNFRSAGLALAVIAGSFAPTAAISQTQRPQTASQPPIALTPQEEQYCRNNSRDAIAFNQCSTDLGIRAAQRARDEANQRIQSNNQAMACLRLVMAARDAGRIPNPGQLTRENVCAIARQFRLG
jgi:hypothetical protein